MKTLSPIETAKSLRILLVDSSPVVRAGLRAMLAAISAEELLHLSEAEDEPEALTKVTRLVHDIAIVDEAFCEPSPKFIQTVMTLSPQLSIITMGSFSNSNVIENLLSAGVSAYIPKNISLRELRAAIRSVIDGEQYICSSVATYLLNKKKGDFSVCPLISKREREILELIVQDKTSQEIASQLFISQRTVETHRKNLMLKLHAKKATGLVRAAYEYNLLSTGLHF